MFFSWSSSKLKVKCLFWKLSPLWKQSYLAFDQFEFNNRDISCYRTEFRVWRQVTKQMKLTYLVRGWGEHGKENKERKKRDQTLSLIIACANGRGKRRDKISYFFYAPLLWMVYTTIYVSVNHLVVIDEISFTCQILPIKLYHGAMPLVLLSFQLWHLFKVIIHPLDSLRQLALCHTGWDKSLVHPLEQTRCCDSFWSFGRWLRKGKRLMISCSAVRERRGKGLWAPKEERTLNQQAVLLWL